MSRTFDCRLERRVLLLAGQILLGMILVFAPYVAANEPAAPEPPSAPPILPQKRLAQLANRTAKPFRVAYLGTSGTMLPLWMAKESGALAREALEVEVISMAASVAIPALVAGDLDAVEMSAAPVLTAALRGHDVVFVAGLLNTMIWSFFVRPEIQRTEELRGKVVGTDRPATPVAYGTLVALKKLGLSPKEVQLYAVGGSAQIVAAFMSGQLAGGIAGPPASFQLERAGFRAVVDLLDVPYQNVGIVIKRSRTDELSNRLVPLLRALRAGIERYYKDRDFAVKVISKYAKETDPGLLERTYEFYRRAGFNRELTISERGVQGILDFLHETVPEAKKALPAQFFDDRFIKKVGGGR